MQHFQLYIIDTVFKKCISKIKGHKLAFLSIFFSLRESSGTSLIVQWLRFLASTAGGASLISGPGNKIPHVMGQLSPYSTEKEPLCCNKDPAWPKLKKKNTNCLSKKSKTKPLKMAEIEESRCSEKVGDFPKITQLTIGEVFKSPGLSTKSKLLLQEN